MNCATVCSIGAITIDSDGMPKVSDAACRSCGACTPACPTGAIQIRDYADAQLGAEVTGLLESVKAEGGR
jgi:heterodisulfide reductase subunit A